MKTYMVVLGTNTTSPRSSRRDTFFLSSSPLVVVQVGASGVQWKGARVLAYSVCDWNTRIAPDHTPIISAYFLFFVL
jgi:hypothetical protein